MIDDLARASRSGGDAERVAFLDAITHLVITSAALSERERELFTDIVERAAPASDVRARTRLATRVADWPHLPERLARELAGETIAVAEPILRQSPVLGTKALMECVDVLGNDHRVAIAKRNPVEGPLAHLLVDRGNRWVWCALSGNPKAIIEPEDRATLIEHGLADGELAATLVRRTDIGEKDGLRLVPAVARYMKNRFRISVENGPLSTAESAIATLDLDTITAKLHAGEYDLNEVVTDLARADRHTDLAKILAEAANFDAMSVIRVLMRDDASGIELLCKAIDVSDDAYRCIVDLRARRMRFSPTRKRYELEDYGNLDAERCRLTLTSLRPKKRGLSD